MSDEPEMVLRVACAISGAPFPSAQSIKKARAAIQAMREPTRDMSNAAHRMDLEAEADPVWADGWRTMIDASLSPSTVEAGK